MYVEFHDFVRNGRYTFFDSNISCRFVEKAMREIKGGTIFRSIERY